MPSTVGKRAIVIGAGIGGLTAARAVAPYFEHVIIIERDALPAEPSDRGDLTLALLESIGLPKPPVTTIGVEIAYATAIFQIPEDAPGDWKGVFHLPMPPSSRGALLLPLEGERWILTLAGRHGDNPPGDEAGFMAFVQSFRTRTIYEAIRSAKRLGDIVRYRFPESI